MGVLRSYPYLLPFGEAKLTLPLMQPQIIRLKRNGAEIYGQRIARVCVEAEPAHQ